MIQKIPHFSGNFDSPFLERFLVFVECAEPSFFDDVEDTTFTEPCDPVDKEKDEELAGVLTGDVPDSVAGLRESVEKMISKKEIITEELHISPDDFEGGMQHVKNEMEVFFQNSPLRSQVTAVEDQISSVSQDSSLSESERDIKILGLKSKQESLSLQFFVAQRKAVETAWRERFPENSGIISYQAMQEKFLHSTEYMQARKKNREEIKNHVTRYPKQGEGIDAYIQLKADLIENDSEKMTHLHSDPFYKIIQFVKSGGFTPLSLADRKVLRQIQSETVAEKHKKGIEGDVKRVGKLKKKTKKGKAETDKEFSDRVYNAQANVLLDTDTYQLAMIEIAKRADILIKNDKSETLEKNKQEAARQGVKIEDLQNIQKSIHTLSPEQEKFLQGIIPQGHSVKNALTDNYTDGATQALGVDKVNLENFFLYEVVGTWGIVTAIANIMVAFKNGNWEEAVPYIMGGAAATYISADMVFNHTLDKVREPEKMAQFIFQEKDNQEYEEFFGNDDEMSLWSNIQWPASSGQEKVLGKSLKGIQKDKDDYVDDTFTASQKEDVDFINKTQNLDITKTLSPEEFKKGGRMESYLPDIIVTMSGEEITKDILLARLQSRGGNRGNHMRYKMFKKTLSRIGDNDSYLPLLHTLNGYAKNENAEKRVLNRNIKERKKDLYKTYCNPAYQVGTRAAQHLKP